MEDALLEGFRAGKRDALERVYWLHVETVETLVRRGLCRVGRFSAADLADVVQEVFEKAFGKKARAAYDGEREYGPFLRQLARHTLYDWLRRRNKEIVRDLDPDALIAEAEPGRDPGPYPAELVLVTEAFVEGLAPDLKAVHERRFQAAESQEHAARVLGISRQNLRTLERRLLDGLRRALRDREHEQRQLAFPSPEHASGAVLMAPSSLPPRHRG
jgi:RNA polymerase sigma factor (sigma-70 family)